MKIGYIGVTRTEVEAGLLPRRLLEKIAVDELVIDFLRDCESPRVCRSRMLRDINAGDTLVVPAFGRLSCSAPEILEIVNDFSCRKIRMISLAEPFDSFDCEESNSLQVLLSLFRLQIESLDIAGVRSKNRRFQEGRPPALNHSQATQVVKMAAAGASTLELTKQFGCSRRTIGRAKNKEHIFSEGSR